MRHTFDIALHRLQRRIKAVADYRRTIGSLRDHLAFVWALAFRGKPRLLPQLHGPIPQGAMGSILPTHVEEHRIYGIANPGGKEFLLICCTKVIMSGVNGNVIMSGCRDDNPDDEGREAARDNTKSVSRRADSGGGRGS